MTSKHQELIEEVGAERVRPLTESRREEYKEASWKDYNADADTALTLSQAREFAEATENSITPVNFDGEFFDTWGRVLNDWSEVELRFAGDIGEYGYLDSVFFCFDQVDDEDEFREYCVLHFKGALDARSEENEGICPFCDERVSVSVSGESLGRPLSRDDEKLWARPHEFDFREYPELGNCVRLWWDE